MEEGEFRFRQGLPGLCRTFGRRTTQADSWEEICRNWRG